MSSDKTMQEMKVLLVDNEPDVTYAIESVLEDNGFEVDSFNDPVLVCDTYKSNYYDLVILDIKMPKMDGFQLYDCIRQKDRKTKICFLTASEMFYESLRQARNLLGDVLGEQYFIQKPIKTDELIRRLIDLINSPQV
jgi:two-component system catabolic regulation response regulator CreB/two-component system response regulator ChvI